MPTPDKPTSFAVMLQRFRAQASLSQEELAERAQLSRRGISDLERGARRSPYPETVRRLADALNLGSTERAELLASAQPALTVVDRVAAEPFPLRIPLTSFIGREHELAQVQSLLATNRLLTLTGPGGIGKTRLALEATRAHSVAALVNLTLVSDDQLVVAAVAAALDVHEQRRTTLLDAITSSLAARTQLLILDNCEQLVSACAQLAAHLLGACQELRILATSRQSLGVAGEQLWQVPPMEVGGSLESDRLIPPDAVRLFAERARLVRPGFELDDQNSPAVAEVCRQLDGLPLAIELAAARAGVLSVSQIATRLHDRFRFLSNGPPTAPERQHTLQATLDWSYGLLSALERALLQRLSVFAGGCTLEMAESICSDETIAVDAVFELLARLVDKSLVSVQPEAGGHMRYRLLETVRRYAVERLADASDGPALTERHSAFFLEFAERTESELWGPRQRLWLDRLEQEHDNLRTALQATVDARHLELAARFCGALWRFWATRGHLSGGRAWTRHILDRAGAEPPLVRSRVLNAEAWLALLQGDIAAATGRAEECLSLRRLAHDERGSAESLTQLAEVARQGGEHNRALALIHESIHLQRLTTNRVGIADSLNILGMILSGRGDASGAGEMFGESLDLRRSLGDVRGIASTLANLGDLALLVGNPRQAAERYEESLALRRDLKDTRGVATALGLLGNIASGQGDRQRAESARLADLPTHGVVASPDVISRPVRQHPPAANWLPAKAPTTLTSREREVASLIAQGLKNREIAEVLTVSERTVHRHVHTILSKLALSSRAQIAAFAVQGSGVATTPPAHPKHRRST